MNGKFRPKGDLFRMTMATAEFLGYDEHGNCEALLSEIDRQALEEGQYPRASGEVQCRCGTIYYDHPRVQGALWLTRTCDGLRKL